MRREQGPAFLVATACGLAAAVIVGSCSSSSSTDLIASCDAICAAQASCGEMDIDQQTCREVCAEQGKLIAANYWQQIEQCVAQGDCDAQKALFVDCLWQVASKAPNDGVDAFLGALCDVVVRCGAAPSQADCVSELQGTLSRPEGGTLLDLFNIFEESTSDCLSGCVSNLSCSEASSSSSGLACLSRCDISIDSFKPSLCEQEECPAHSHCVEKGNDASCVCDDGYHVRAGLSATGYRDGTFTCVPNCSADSCGDHGTCGEEGACVCDSEYYLGSDETCHVVTHFVSLAANADHLCAIRDDGAVECRKDCTLGGNVAVSEAANYTQVAMVEGHSLTVAALRQDSGFDTWTRLEDPLPDGDPNSGIPSTELAAGEHLCSLRANLGDIWCNGMDTPVASASDLPFERVFAGGRTVCATKQGVATCWGDEAKIPEPNADWIDLGLRRGFGNLSCGIKSDNTMRCWWGFTGQEIAVPEPNKDFIKVAVGDFACGLKKDKTVECWDDSAEQIEVATEKGYQDLAAGGDRICGVREDGIIRCWDERGTFECYLEPTRK